MPGKERRKQVERERYQRQLARRMRKDERNRTIKAVVASVAIVVVIVGGMGALAYAISKDEKDPEAMPTKDSPKPKQNTSAAAKPNECAYQEVPAQGGQLKDVGTPPKKKVKKDRTATVATNRGNLRVSLFGEKAPCTVNSFSYLAGKKFFDNTSCHRVVNKGFYVLQCGKPAGKAQGPSYQYGTENVSTKGMKKGESLYKKGVLAMANSGTPDSNGSQFFIVYKESDLPPQYTVFGQVTGGMGMVEQVGKAGPTKEDPQVGGGPPKKKVTIEKVSVSK
ncbi:MAG: peptidylprolyl isomerase [Streptosporangiales bacterium]|nr:peptidylprolyl isomerase [Streptosporangiales bacterium]